MPSVQRTRRSARGVTLIEVMIVVAILGLLAASIAIAVTHQWRKAQIEVTVTNAKTLRQIAATWRQDHGIDDCPTAERLADDKLVDRSAKMTDAWGSPFVIRCEGDETSVVSYGPDRHADSTDDLVEPDPMRGRVAVER